MQLGAVSEGLLLDPVYTAKGFAGFIAEQSAGRIAADVPIVFLHTGGLPPSSRITNRHQHRMRNFMRPSEVPPLISTAAIG